MATTIDSNGQLHDGSGRFAGSVNTGPSPLEPTRAPMPQRNDHREHFDRKRGERPLRPYLPLNAADDDEFFGAPEGTVLEIGAKDSRDRLRYRRAGEDTWDALNRNGVATGQVTAYQLWNDVVVSGDVDKAILRAPHTHLVGDERGWVARADVDKPLTATEVRERVAGGGYARAVSQSWYDDSLGGGIAAGDEGNMDVSVTDYGTVRFTNWGGGHREFKPDEYQCFDRDGDLVFRREQDAGFGFEFSYRIDQTKKGAKA